MDIEAWEKRPKRVVKTDLQQSFSAAAATPLGCRWNKIKWKRRRQSDICNIVLSFSNQLRLVKPAPVPATPVCQRHPRTTAQRKHQWKLCRPKWQNWITNRQRRVFFVALSYRLHTNYRLTANGAGKSEKAKRFLQFVCEAFFTVGFVGREGRGRGGLTVWGCHTFSGWMERDVLFSRPGFCQRGAARIMKRLAWPAPRPLWLARYDRNHLSDRVWLFCG